MSQPDISYTGSATGQKVVNNMSDNFRINDKVKFTCEDYGDQLMVVRDVTVTPSERPQVIYTLSLPGSYEMYDYVSGSDIYLVEESPTVEPEERAENKYLSEMIEVTMSVADYMEFVYQKTGEQ